MNKPHHSHSAAPAQRVPPVALNLQTMPGGWLSVAKAAGRAGVCPRTIKRWIWNGHLPATRTPSLKGKGHLRIRLGDLEALLARGLLQ
jgi:excisionase family DNA binding protein